MQSPAPSPRTLSLLPVLCLATACGGDGGARATDAAPVPREAGADGDAAVCEAPNTLRYEAPGCGAAAAPVCGRSNQDGCRRNACSCAGVVLAGCDYAREPFAYWMADPSIPEGSACDPHHADGGVEELRGVLRYAFEQSSFTLCGSGEKWWTDFGAPPGGPFVAGAAILNRPEVWVREGADGGSSGSGWTFVRVRGSVSAPGRYGHLGQYPRELTIDEVLSAMPSVPSDCAR